jgi:hypothetical protein
VRGHVVPHPKTGRGDPLRWRPLQRRDALLPPRRTQVVGARRTQNDVARFYGAAHQYIPAPFTFHALDTSGFGE